VAAVEVELDEAYPGVATVRLNQPERRNALSAEVVADLVAAFDRIESDSALGAVVVTGAPPAFCAGGSLSDLENLETTDDALAIYEGFLRVRRSPLPTIAAVNGAAVGAGLNLAISCDLLLASNDARFDARFLDLGLHPGGGSTWLLREAAGHQAVVAMVLFGQILSGEEAAAAGLVYRCVPADELLPVALSMAARAASFPRQLVRRTKENVRAMAGVRELDDAVALEVAAQLWSAGQPDFAERLAALQARIAGR